MVAFGDRYRIERRIGAGGMGVVYQAFDTEKQRSVALKTLARLSPAAIYRFKQEFRALSDVSHPNLIALHELASHEDRLFFTMDLVEGTDFLSWIGRGSAPALAPDALQRLRDALKQLVSGVAALHAAGKLHRDLKPSNVLVTTEGRVVIVDFGLVSEIERDPRATDGGAVGTIAYMAPEQAAAAELGPAADWYAVGVMLYQALAGRFPFTDGLRAPSEISAGVPEDLDRLVMQLLLRDAKDRPSDEAMLAGVAAPPPKPRLTSSLVGRDRELLELHRFFTTHRAICAAIAELHGASGLGKTALAGAFLAQVREDRAVMIVQGRCHEQESVAYKAFDALIDSLSGQLLRADVAFCSAIVPRNVYALTRVFPTLARVPAFAAASRPLSEPLDAIELRRRAFDALREMLARIADRRPLIAFIDDLQWSDADSAVLWAHLMRPPDPPAIFLLVAYRPEASGAFFSELDRAAIPRLKIAVEPLSATDAASLARAVDVDPARAERVARESGGSPFLVQELAHHSGTLLDAIRARLAVLPPSASRLLATIATAGYPLPKNAAINASNLGSEQHEVLAALKAARLIRTDRDLIDASHDRIRETIAEDLSSAETIEIHRRLVDALEGASPELLMRHSEAAGDPVRAAQLAEAAADRAHATLAFDRAAELYRHALELSQQRPPALIKRLGEALANAGRGREAAAAFNEAIHGVDPAEAIDLRRRAAEQLLRSGYLDEGVAALGPALKSAGLSGVPTHSRALLEVLLGRARVALRGVDAPRPAHRIAPEAAQRIDVLWAAAVGLGTIDPIRGAAFQARHLSAALAAAEPYRVARAIALETAYSGMRGAGAEPRIQRLAQIAETSAERSKEPHAIGLVIGARGVARALIGRWNEARPDCEAAEAIFLERCTGVAWELSTVRYFALLSLLRCGELAELRRRAPDWIRDAEARSDRYTARTYTGAYLSWGYGLAEDDPQRAAEFCEDGLRGWPEYAFQRVWMMRILAEIALYRGDLAEATKHAEAALISGRKTFQHRIQIQRIEVASLRGRLFVARRDPDAAAKEAKQLEREPAAYAAPLASLIRAGIAAIEGDSETQRDRLIHAEKAAETTGMGLHAACARRRLGELTRETSLIDSADQWMEGQKIKSPSNFARLLAPI